MCVSPPPHLRGHASQPVEHFLALQCVYLTINWDLLLVRNLKKKNTKKTKNTQKNPQKKVKKKSTYEMLQRMADKEHGQLS